MLEHITKRRSIFPQFFTDEPVSDDSLRAVLEAANHAPSHKKTEPWRYFVYRGAGKATLLRQMSEIYEANSGPGSWTDQLEKKFGKKIDQSPVVLLVFLSRDANQSVPEWEEIAAVACSVQNLWTSLDAYNLGGYWSSPGFLCGGYGEFPGVAPNMRCLGTFYLGHYQAPELPRPRGGWEDKVTFIGE